MSVASWGQSRPNHRNTLCARHPPKIRRLIVLGCGCNRLDNSYGTLCKSGRVLNGSEYHFTPLHSRFRAGFEQFLIFASSSSSSYSFLLHAYEYDGDVQLNHEIGVFENFSKFETFDKFFQTFEYLNCFFFVLRRGIYYSISKKRG